MTARPRPSSLALTLLAPLALLAAPARAQDALQADFRRVVREAKAKVFPAVVFIKCVRESHEEGKRQSQEVSGSGVILDPKGEVLTNWHVIDKAIEVRCQLADGTALAAKVVGSDKPTDLAILQLELPEGSAPLPWASFGDSAKLTEGDFVMAMGAPWGLNRSVSIGIISCTTRYLPEASEYSHWLQTDASINPGNSGGPLVDTEGRVIGVNTRGGGDMGFAIPSETVQLLLPHLRKGAIAWSWTGLQLQPLRDFNRNVYFDGDRGVIVAETDPGSPARKAGLRPRDRLLSVAGQPLTALSEEDLPHVRRALGLLPRGEPVTFEVQRDGDTLRVELVPREKGQVEGDELDCPRWDVTVKAINQFDNPDLYFYRREGVFVFGVKYPGNGQRAGLQQGDIIFQVDGKPVTTLEELAAIHKASLENHSTKPRLVLGVLRRGLMRQHVLDISRDYSND